MPGAHAEPVPGRHQSGSFPLCPVCELAPFSCPICPGSGVRAAVFRLYPVCESAPFSCPISPELASERQFSALSMGKLALFLRPISPKLASKRQFPRLCPVCESALFPASSAPNWRQSGSLSPCRMGGHRNSPSPALRRFKLRNSPRFSRSFAFMREKRKMYSVQKFPCPSGTIASALKIVPKPIDNLRRVLYNATMLLR